MKSINRLESTFHLILKCVNKIPVDIISYKIKDDVQMKSKRENTGRFSCSRAPTTFGQEEAFIRKEINLCGENW